MFTMREYDPYDSLAIITWIDSEREFYLWSAGSFGDYPVSEWKFNRLIMKRKTEEDFHPFIFYDETDIRGFLAIRKADSFNQIFRLAYVILDKEIRGKGIGKEMVRLAVKHAFNRLNASKVTLGVFDNNEAAIKCYEGAGFCLMEESRYHDIGNEKWLCQEMEITK